MQKSVNGSSPVTLLIELLRKRRTEPPSRQFLRFHYTHNSARDLQLREVLRDPTIYQKHPDPEAAAAIMVSESFGPQIQGLLFNYTKAAEELDIEQARSDDLSNCACHSCFKSLQAADLGPVGHVCTFDTRSLKWPYLTTLTQLGKKFRVPASSDTVAQELEAALANYLSWATKKEQDARRLQKFQDWADAVRDRAMANWKAAQASKPIHEMDGYPGLRQAIQEARGFWCSSMMIGHLMGSSLSASAGTSSKWPCTWQTTKFLSRWTAHGGT